MTLTKAGTFGEGLQNSFLSLVMVQRAILTYKLNVFDEHLRNPFQAGGGMGRGNPV